MLGPRTSASGTPGATESPYNSKSESEDCMPSIIEESAAAEVLSGRALLNVNQLHHALLFGFGFYHGGIKAKSRSNDRNFVKSLEPLPA